MEAEQHTPAVTDNRLAILAALGMAIVVGLVPLWAVFGPTYPLVGALVVLLLGYPVVQVLEKRAPVLDGRPPVIAYVGLAVTLAVAAVFAVMAGQYEYLMFGLPIGSLAAVIGGMVAAFARVKVRPERRPYYAALGPLFVVAAGISQVAFNF